MDGKVVIVTEPEPEVRVIDPGSELRVVVVEIGTPGPQGKPGPAGPAGGRNPVTVELTDISSWNYSHDFPYLPDVRLIATDDEEVGVAVKYPTDDSIFIEFPSPFTGRAIIS